MKRDGRSSRRPIGHSGRPQRARVRAIRVSGRCARRRASSSARQKQASRPQRRQVRAAGLPGMPSISSLIPESLGGFL